MDTQQRKGKRNGDQKREAQELAELRAHHRTALSCQTRTGERQRKRGLGASTSHTTSNAGSRQMEVHRAKQHLTKVGYTASCASWDLRECGLTAQSKPRWEDSCATLVHTLTSSEQFSDSSRGMGKSARKQYSTQRSDGPRPSTPQLLTLPFVVRMPHVTEAA